MAGIKFRALKRLRQLAAVRESWRDVIAPAHPGFAGSTGDEHLVDFHDLLYYYLDFLGPLEAIARGFASPVIHILFASVWAYWITRAHIGNEPIARPAISGFVLAAGSHGIYDFLVLRYPVAALPLAAAMIGALWLWRLQVMRRMHDSAVGESGER